MKLLKITNKKYYNILIALIGGLLIWNIYATISSQNLKGIVGISIQSILILLLLTKNYWTQKVIKLWLIISFFIGRGLIIIGIGLQALGMKLEGTNGGLDLITSNKVIYSILYIITGIIVWILNEDFGKVNNTDNS